MTQARTFRAGKPRSPELVLFFVLLQRILLVILRRSTCCACFQSNRWPRWGCYTFLYNTAVGFPCKEPASHILTCIPQIYLESGRISTRVGLLPIPMPFGLCIRQNSRFPSRSFPATPVATHLGRRTSLSLSVPPSPHAVFFFSPADSTHETSVAS